ncbi:MAG: apolipoprotein N-acyltransferase [Pyrinomonadaceae bacterium]
MKISSFKNIFPSATNAFLALLSAILLILSFPDFEFWILAWVALVPLFSAIGREKEFWRKSFFLGWIFGTIFFFGTCWWLTFAPITYAQFPPLLAYILMFCVALTVGIFPAIFSALFSILLKRLGSYATLAAPFLWTAIEFLRFSITGNNWNAIGYSHAFQPILLSFAAFGGVYLTGFFIILFNSVVTFEFLQRYNREKPSKFVSIAGYLLAFSAIFAPVFLSLGNNSQNSALPVSNVVAVQPNVPMSGIKYDDWTKLRDRHVQLAESALQKFNEQRTTSNEQPAIIIFPESPMIFMYSEDSEFREFLTNFASRNNAYILFNAAEPDAQSKHNFNSAVMINPKGEKIAQYDKIHLLPFGEFQPLPDFLASEIPAFVGSFSFGNEFDLIPFGEAKGGVMICFESHFASLSREYAGRGADFLIEMTNDGYLGNTPVLRQHLANSVFRAVETNRPLLRVTNVGVTAYINERGEVLDAADVYTEATRVWTVAKSDAKSTFYVKYGDWFAWLCSIVSLALLFLSFRKRKINEQTNPENIIS